jgi:hypothetical protein
MAINRRSIFGTEINHGCNDQKHLRCWLISV